MTNTVRLGKLKWLCRRGMKELDVLLERFTDSQARICGAIIYDNDLDWPPRLSESAVNRIPEPLLSIVARDNYTD